MTSLFYPICFLCEALSYLVYELLSSGQKCVLWGHNDFDLRPPKSHHLISESKCTFVPNLKKLPQGSLEIPWSQERNGCTENLKIYCLRPSPAGYHQHRGRKNLHENTVSLNLRNCSVNEKMLNKKWELMFCHQNTASFHGLFELILAIIFTAVVTGKIPEKHCPSACTMWFDLTTWWYSGQQQVYI